MRLPILLPKELGYTSVAETDLELFNMLLNKPHDFLSFFEAACDDETWSLQHQEFFKFALKRITDLFYQDQVETEFCKRILNAIQRHVAIDIPKNLTFVLKDDSVPASGLLWSAGSEKLRTIIRQECRDRHTNTFTLPELTKNLFEQIDEFLRFGTIEDLQTKSNEQLLQLLNIARKWDLEELISKCEKSLKKFISRENMWEMLLFSQKNGLPLLRQFCFDFINAQDLGLFFKNSEIDSLVVGFHNFSDKALHAFEKIKNNITDIAGLHIDIINQVPHLKGIDLSLSEWNPELLNLEINLIELNLSRCSWLTPDYMEKIFLNFPLVERLDLSHNSQLSYDAWSTLHLLKHLISLNISYCNRINDDEFKLILNACRSIHSLSLEGCNKLTSEALFEITYLHQLSHLDVQKTNVNDKAILAIVERCTNLIQLNVKDCPHISAKAIDQIKKIRPYLKIQKTILD